VQETKLYSTEEIAELLKKPTSTVYSQIARQGIKYVKRVKNTKYYALVQFQRSKEAVIMYYPLKTTETFHIYESKLNNQ